MEACDHQAPSKIANQSELDLTPVKKVRVVHEEGAVLKSSNSTSCLDEILKKLDDFSLHEKNLENGICNGNGDIALHQETSKQNSKTSEEKELILSVDAIEDKADDAKQTFTAKRSISTPESRIEIVPNLVARPKTINTNEDKIISDSPKRLKRKESFLKTVGNIFKKKVETPANVPKHVTVNVQKPIPHPGSECFLKDLIYKFKDGDFKMRWCFLRIDFFINYLDSDYKHVEECLSMDSVVSVQLLDGVRFDFKIDDAKLFCFEIRTTTDRFVFGCKTKEDRNRWMQKIAESLNWTLAQSASEIQRIGWIYAREGINGVWFGAWMLLSNRKIFYHTNNEASHMFDLRKARCILLQEPTDGDCIPLVLEQGPYMLIDCQKASFYFQSWNLIDTEGWYSSIKGANKNGSRLEDQQLYSYNVPVIAEKCINFIYLHGSLLCGIYRRAGHLTKSEEIVTQFKQDAWTTQLPSDTYSGYDVASAFKKFFSDLSEPIISISIQEKLREIFSNSDEDQRASSYQAVFESCPKITYNTLRMLFRHLHFIVEYQDKNLMTSENLASVWGVTILRSEISGVSSSNAEYLAKDLGLVQDLIELSGKIFPESEKERHHEMLVRQTWERHISDIKRPRNENFRIWIYFGSKEGQSYNIEVGLHKTAKEICEELSHELDIPASKLVLEEFVLNGSLNRPIHYDEKVLDVVLKWTYWDDDDKRDNYLTVCNLDKYEAYLMDSMFPAMMEVRFADRKTKQFHTYTFQLSCGQINIYKDANKTQQVKSWNVDDIEWYIGNAKGRNPPTKYTITFLEKVEKQNKTDALPFFGNVLSFTTEFTKITWVSSLWKEQYKREFLPLAMEFLIKRCQDNQK